jgi:hypothetical protein
MCCSAETHGRITLCRELRPEPMRTPMLDRLRKEDFEPLIGQKVTIVAGGASAELEVAEASSLKSPSPRETPPFRIILRSREGWRAPQGMFRISHPTLGDLDLFAVPIGPDAEGFCYEILFN